MLGFYLSVGMDKNDFGTTFFDCPKVIGYFSMEEMNQKVLAVELWSLKVVSIRIIG